MPNLFKKHWGVLAAALVLPPLLLLLRSRLGSTGQRAQSPAYDNLRAFLTMIQYAEGTYGNNAYRTLYGGQLFTGYDRHPNIAVTKNGITSTAAGAYQILYGTWTGVAQSTGLPDFSPISQDRAAVVLIARRGALDDVLAGKFADALYKCRKEWASFPGAGYGQGERTLAALERVYRGAGGQVAI